ncbi:MAG: AEC family transporter [Desulfosarcina sp.]|nr:AEC family transporter [Desulfobacterales bacterium]
MVLNSLFPVFALIAIGMVFKHWQLTTTDFLKTADRLVYFIFFPALLFWKIGGSPPSPTASGHFYLAAALAVLLIYLVSLAYICWRVPAFQAGTFSQSCYRFNTYIGMAIVINALGEEGVRQFGILIGFLIPTINVLAVSTLTWYSGRHTTGAKRIRQAIRAMMSNPLIIACVTGLIYSRAVGRFPVFIHNALGLMAAITLPLALLSIGGTLTLTGLRKHWGQSLVGAVFKLVVLPLTGWTLFLLMGVGGLDLKIGMIYLALPTSPAIYVLSSQLNSDTQLASAAIVLSTALSFISLTIVLTVFG